MTIEAIVSDHEGRISVIEDRLGDIVAIKKQVSELHDSLLRGEALVPGKCAECLAHLSRTAACEREIAEIKRTGERLIGWLCTNIIVLLVLIGGWIWTLSAAVSELNHIKSQVYRNTQIIDGLQIKK